MSGLDEARRKGHKLGRPEGTTLDTAELLAKHKDIVRQLKDGQSVRNTAKITGKGMSTVQRVKAVLGTRSAVASLIGRLKPPLKPYRARRAKHIASSAPPPFFF